MKRGAAGMETWLAIGLGAALAAIVACGGSTPRSQTVPGVARGGGGSRQRIDELAARIDADLARMNVPPPMLPLASDPRPTSVTPSNDPTCKRGATASCSDSCTLADSICDNARRICEIAVELGDDAYANTKCDGGRASCEAARGRCCGCE